MQNFESPHQPTSESNDWDMSQVPFAGDALAEQAETNLDPAEQAIENVRYWGQAYNDLEAQFIQYRETVDLNDPKARSDYKTMLRRYEEEVHNVWGYMEDATQAAHVYNRLGDPYSRSAAQGIDIPDNKEGDTVEVSSSIFYATRVHALERAVQHDSSLSPEERQARDELLSSTWEKVLARIEANQAMVDRRQDTAKHFRRCNELHDDLIRHLNQLNDLADSYGLERLTPRNFITNDWNYSAARDHNLDYHARVESDRTIVDFYFRRVFSREYAEVDYKTSRDLGISMR